MKLWKISQTENNGWDTYSDAVVAAETIEEARLIHPSGQKWDGKDKEYSSWCPAEKVEVEYLGDAKEGMEAGVICASFHAG